MTSNLCDHGKDPATCTLPSHGEGERACPLPGFQGTHVDVCQFRRGLACNCTAVASRTPTRKA